MQSTSHSSCQSSRKRSHLELSSSDPAVEAQAKRWWEWQEASKAWKTSYDQKVAQCVLRHQRPVGPAELYSDLFASDCPEDKNSNETNIHDPPLAKSTVESSVRPNVPQSALSEKNSRPRAESSLQGQTTAPHGDLHPHLLSKETSSILLAPETPTAVPTSLPWSTKQLSPSARSVLPTGFFDTTVTSKTNSALNLAGKPSSILLAPETPGAATTSLSHSTKNHSPGGRRVLPTGFFDTAATSKPKPASSLWRKPSSILIAPETPAAAPISLVHSTKHHSPGSKRVLPTGFLDRTATSKPKSASSLSRKPSSTLLAPETPTAVPTSFSHFSKHCSPGARRVLPTGFLDTTATSKPNPESSLSRKPSPILLAPETPEASIAITSHLTKPRCISPQPVIDKTKKPSPKVKHFTSPEILDLSNVSPPTREHHHHVKQFQMTMAGSSSRTLPQGSNSTTPASGSILINNLKPSRPNSKLKQIATFDDYDGLSTKERLARFSSVKSWAEFLFHAVRMTKSHKIKDFMKKCRVYYLINPRTQTKLDEADRMRMRRLAEVGAQIEPELKANHVTHLVVRDRTSWNSCHQAIKSVVHDPIERQKIKEMCLSSSDKTPGEDLIWIVDFKWVETCLTYQAVPAEKYMRIFPPTLKNLLPQKPPLAKSCETKNTRTSVLPQHIDHSQSSYDEIETSMSFNSGKYQAACSKETEVIIPGLECQLQLARLGEGVETDGSQAEEIHLDNPPSSSSEEDSPAHPPVKNKNAHTLKRNGPNEDICQKLEKVIELYSNSPNDQSRILDIQKTVNILRSQSKRTDDFDTLVKLKGIGPKTAHKVVEIANTSTHRRLQLVSEQDTCRRCFKGIYGVNDTLAIKWYKKGLRTLDDVRDRKGGISLSTSQELGLRFYKDLQERIPRDEVELIVKQVTQTALELDPRLKIIPTGSYRRGEENCGGIDVIVTRDASDGQTYHDSMRRLYDQLNSKGLITYELSSTKKADKNNVTYACLSALDREGFGKQRRLDLLGVPHDRLGAALIYFTGNAIFSRALRLKARQMGYVLRQHGLFTGAGPDPRMEFAQFIPRTGAPLTTPTHACLASQTEEDVFMALHLQFVPPSNRIM